MITRISAWLTGYVIIKLKGPDLEMLLNRIVAADLGLWDLDRVTPNIIIAKVRASHFQQLRPLLRGLETRVSIVGRGGLPFILHKLKHRQLLLFGLIAFFVFMYYLSGFIWFVQIDGCEQVTKEEILAVVNDQGFRIGHPRKGFNTGIVEVNLLSNIPELSWVGVTIKGSLMRIQVAERTSPDLSLVQVGNLAASRNGVISQVILMRGTAMVTPGATVKKGDILISSRYYDQQGKLQDGRAEGLVKARVWYQANAEASFTNVVQTFTGQTHTNYVVTLGNWNFTSGRKPSFDVYSIDVQPLEIDIRGHKLPLSISKHTYEEVFYETVSLSKQQAQDTALQRAWEQLALQGVERELVIDSRIEEYMIADEHGVRIGLIVEVEEDITEFVPIL